ncbi:MAG: class I SAM-dependent methyltransferase [Elusimicrobiota bacterium]
MSRKLPEFYSDPALYDLIHADGTDDEVWLLDSIAARHGNGGKKAIEPACGTGRYLAGLLRRGWTVSGYDLSPKMVEYARKRLAKWGEKAEISRGDMISFESKKKYDLAFNTLSTFRHLLTERDAVAHLRGTYDLLNPGGIYILGLDLAAYGEDQPDEEVWKTRCGGKTIVHVMETLPPDARRRRERIINFVTVPDKGGDKVLESAYDLRSYDSGELANLILKTKFSLPACYGYDGKPASLCGTERALWLVLRKAPAA